MVSLSSLLTNAWRALTAVPADPRDETSAQAQRRLRHLERSAIAVRNKIELVYAFNGYAASDTGINQEAATIAQELIGYARPRHIMERFDIPRETLQQAMQRGIHDYLQVFHLQRALTDLPATHEGYEHYDSTTAKENLLKIYANHLTNATEARFIASGADAFEAHFLNGLIIRTTLDMARKAISEEIALEPAQLRPETDLQHLKQIDQLRGYWRSRVTELKGALASSQHYTRS